MTQFGQNRFLAPQACKCDIRKVQAMDKAVIPCCPLQDMSVIFKIFLNLFQPWENRPMNRISLLLCLTLIIPMIQSCVTAPKGILMRDDPLIGKIVDTSTGRYITFKTLMDEITSHDIIYLSEKHDNPMQHAIQHRIIQELIDRDRLPALGFEFFAMEDTPHLLNFLDSARIAHTAKQESVIKKDLRRKLGWEKQSDIMWAYYFDLLKLGRNNGLTLAGLDLSSVQKRRITRKGTPGLTPLETKRIFSTHLTNPVYQNHTIHESCYFLIF